MNIRDTHAYLVTLIGGLSITAPVAKTMGKAWKFTPPTNTSLAELPATICTYQLERVDFKPSFLEEQFSIHIQLFAGLAAAEGDIAADIASAFLEALILALSSRQTLGGNVAVIRGMRGGGSGPGGPETLVVLPWGGVGYVGLDLYLEVTLKTAKEHGV
jgi:hypothetical protein